MKLRLTLFSFCMALLLAFGCQMNNNSNQDQQSDAKETTEFIDATEDQETYTDDYIEADPYREPTNDELRETGIVISIEDGPYPMFSLNIEFPKIEAIIAFSLNIEALSPRIESIYDYQDKYMSFYYLAESQADLYDMHFEGSSVFGEWAPEFDPEWNMMKGILSGADSPSGDLPNEVSITEANGTTLDFEVFIDDVMMKANGKEVVVYYGIRDRNIITHILPLE